MTTFSYEEAAGAVPSGGNTFSYEDATGGAAPAKKVLGPPEELTWYEKLASYFPDSFAATKGGKVGGFVRGAADPVVGAVQLAANALPGDTGAKVNKWVADEEREYQQLRDIEGRKGFDFMRTGGQIASPTNLAIAAKLPTAVTTMGRVGQGAVVGGGTGAMEPVVNTERGYWNQKAGQVGAGAAGGAVLTPILGKVGDAIARRLQGAKSADPAAVDRTIKESLEEIGQSIDDLPPGQLDALRSKAVESLRGGGELDPAAALRKADFEALEIEPTLGQVTREPMQYARERLLRGVEGAGEPLMSRLERQQVQLRDRVSTTATGAKEPYQAGVQLSESLKGLDEKLQGHVSGLYREARASAGKDLDVPLQGLAQDYAGVLENFGDKVPSAIRSQFAALGLDPSVVTNQRAVFTIEGADRLQKAINSHVGADPVTNRALGELRGALRRAVEGADSTGGPFAPAVKAAKERFELHDAIPALKAASDGSIAPDDFVKKFVIAGKTDEVKALGDMLKTADPDTWQQARAQIGESLRKAALGENVAGDAAFNSRRLIEQANRIGMTKLSAFFDPEEVLQIMLMGRVGAYIGQQPATAAVNNANTAGAVMNLASAIPGFGAAAAVANKAVGAVRNRRDVNRALEARVPIKPALPSEGHDNVLRGLLGAGAFGGAVPAAGAVTQKERIKRDPNRPSNRRSY